MPLPRPDWLRLDSPRPLPKSQWREFFPPSFLPALCTVHTFARTIQLLTVLHCFTAQVINKLITTEAACTKEAVAAAVWDASGTTATCTVTGLTEGGCETPLFSDVITPAAQAKFRSWDAPASTCIEYPPVAASNPDYCVGYRYTSWKTAGAAAAAASTGVCEASVHDDGDDATNCYLSNHQCSTSTVCRPGYEALMKSASSESDAEVSCQQQFLSQSFAVVLQC